MAKSSTVRLSPPAFTTASKASTAVRAPATIGTPEVGKKPPTESKADRSTLAESASAPNPQPVQVPAISPPGPRKLIRPPLDKMPAARRQRRSELFTVAAYRTPQIADLLPLEDTHAEAFYLQKQAQMQTAMVVVLEDGERIEGVIEWYDRDAIKVRHRVRTLVYKSSIKYLYKSSETRFR